MAAGLGFKTFTTGEVLTAADVNGYLMQGVLVFASAAARNAAITSPQEGQFAFTKDTNGLWYYDGAAWVASGATGDIEGVTAGIGISGGGTSGTVTITNSMATAIDAKGDLIGGTGADTFSRLAVGANDTVLTADSGEATGLKWAAVAGVGTWSSAASGSFTSTSVTISSLTGREYMIQVNGLSTGGDNTPLLRFNGDSGNNYGRQNVQDGFNDGMTFGRTGSAGAALNGIVYIPNANETTMWKFAIGGRNGDVFGGFYKGTSAITSITFDGNGGTFDSGTYVIWKRG